MKGIFILCAIALSLTLTPARGQATGPQYRQFFFNPYLFNPAFVGINNRAEANLVYRQQWINFADAPVAMGANVQFPTSNRVALGFNVFSEKQVLLRNTNFTATFGYIVPIAANQSLRFGLSGGVGLNKLDLTADELNTNDPVIANASGNNFYVNGNFGVVYTNAGLKLGFALTDIFKSNSFSAGSFNELKLSNLKNRLYSASYKFDLDVMGNVSLEPYVLYRQSADGLQDAWEVASLVYFKDKFWTGGSYNQNNGLALFLGMNVKETFRFSYSYEFPPFGSGFTSNSSHELHLGIKLGNKKSKYVAKTSRGAVPVYREVENDAVIPEDESQEAIAEVESDEVHQEVENNAVTRPPENNSVIPVEEKSISDPAMTSGGKKHQKRFVISNQLHPVETEAPIVTPIVTKEEEPAKVIPVTPAKAEEINRKTPKAPALKPNEAFTMTRGHYYVVVGVFGVLDNSMRFTKEMISKGYHVNVALNPENDMYYVYIDSTFDEEEAKKVRNEYKRKNLFKDAWVFTLE